MEKLSINLLSVLIFILLLSCGCFWQIIKVCNFYFGYPTSVAIETIFKPKAKPLPALTFCTNVGDDDEVTNAVFENSTEALQYQSNKYKNETFSWIYIKGVKGDEFDLKEEWLAHSVERVSLNYYCITFNSLLTVKESFQLNVTDELNFYFDKFGPKNVWWLYMHSSNEMPSSSEWNAVEIKNHTNVQLSWKLQSFRLLESPYPTNCKNYPPKHLSRNDCVRKCKINESTSECYAVSAGLDLMLSDKAVKFAKYWEIDCVKEINFDAVCDLECPLHDCEVDFYEPYVWQHGMTSTYTRVALTIPTKPETAFKHEPRLELIEFICYLASTVSMYFGLSFISLITFCQFVRNQFFKRVMKKGKMTDDQAKSHRLMRNRILAENELIKRYGKMNRMDPYPSPRMKY